MPTPSPLPPISLSPPSARERLARYTAPPAHSSPPPMPSPLLPSSGCIYITPTTTYLYTNFYHPPIDRRDDIPGQAAPIIVCQHRRGLKRDDKEISEVGNGIRETWVDLAEASSGDSTTTLGELAPDARFLDHQDASRDDDSHI
ncbi:hypothetical protein Tco_0093338 [Tanacetum coccineum]